MMIICLVYVCRHCVWGSSINCLCFVLQVCAHKWKFRGEDNGANRLVQGLCLQSGRDLQNFQVLRPCTYERGSGDFLVLHLCVYTIEVCVCVTQDVFVCKLMPNFTKSVLLLYTSVSTQLH